MELRVVHTTRYDYPAPVMLAQHLAHLQPLDGMGQHRLVHRLSIDPPPAQHSHGVDAYGNGRCFFALESPHEHLTVTADTLLHIDPAEPVPASPAWEAVREHFRYRAQAPYQTANEFVYSSPYVPRHEDFAVFAAPDFTPGRPLLQACEALMARIHRDLRYDSESTEVHTPARQALALRRGVCQDFAHIMIACLRSLGLPARYVSGYLLTQPPPGKPRLIGADASHAWVSVYSPALGSDNPCSGVWVDFDPTNRRSGMPRPGEDYVTLAIGRDFGDVSPLRGVIQGGGQHTLHVGVTVAPPAEFETLRQRAPNTPSAAPQAAASTPSGPAQAPEPTETPPHEQQLPDPQ